MVYVPVTATDRLARRAYVGLELDLRAGALVVTDIDPGSPAEAACLQVDDVLLRIDGEPVCGLVEVRRRVGALAVGRTSELGIRRRGELRSVRVEVAEMPVEQLPRGRVELDQVCWRGHRLRVLWSWPEGPGPHPLIWLLPGAGWWPEEQPTSPTYPTRLFMERLTARGIATLRIERSGVGDSEGPSCRELDLEAELEAFRSGFDQLRGHPRVRWDAALVFGRSLGGMLAALLTPEHDFAGLAVWGTSAEPWHDALLSSSMRQLALRGFTPAELAHTHERLEALQRLIYIDGMTPAEARAAHPELDDVMPSVYQGDMAHGRVARYFQQLQRAEVARCIEAFPGPVLAMHGECDWLAEARSAAHIAWLAGERGQHLEFSGLDHMMHVRSGLQEAFDEPWAGDFSPAAADALADFVGRVIP